MDNMMEITRIYNGFIVSLPNEAEDGYTQRVFEMADNPENVNRPSDGEDLDTWRRLLYVVMNHFGYFPSYKDDKLIDINIIDGEKSE